MTTCYFVSDLHGDKNKYELLVKEIARKKPSFLFLGGDLLPHVKISEKQKSLSASNPQFSPSPSPPFPPSFTDTYLIPLFKHLQDQLGCNYPEVYLILGNDDYKADLPGFERGAEKELWKLLNNSKVKFGPYWIYGYSYVPPTPFRLKDWEKYDIDNSVPVGAISPEDGFRSVPVDDVNTIKEDLQLLTGAEKLDKSIFILHSPPFGTHLDKIPGNISIGSKAIAEFIAERQPYITLHGHAHESSSITGIWHQQFNYTHSFSAAWDGKGLSLVIFQIDNPAMCERKILE